MSDTANPPVKFALGTFSYAGSPAFAGLVIEDERVIPLEALQLLCLELRLPLVASSTLAVIEQWACCQEALQAAANEIAAGALPTARRIADDAVPMSSLRVLPPVASRQLFLCGANYFKHVVDMAVDWGPGKVPGTEGMNPEELREFAEDMMRRRQREGMPYVFCKPVSVLSGAYDAIEIPVDAVEPDWEVELVAVIGKPARRVSREDALDYVAGYSIGNDITDRGRIWVTGDMKAMGTDWFSSKCSPTYLPVGPYMVPAAHVGNPQDLQLELRLNGKVMQNENTGDMIFDVARQIEHISSVVQLLPGDLICTGSPAGNGTHYNRYLQEGDVVEAAITGLGRQRTPVISERN